MQTNEEVKNKENSGGKISNLFDCYIVIWEDRHSDTTAHPFMLRDTAITEAIKTAKEHCRYPEDYEVVTVEGWELCINYSCEGDNVRVVKTTMNQPI